LRRYSLNSSSLFSPCSSGDDKTYEAANNTPLKNDENGESRVAAGTSLISEGDEDRWQVQERHDIGESVWFIAVAAEESVE